MNTDIRLATSFPYHPKIQKLKRRLGPEGAWGWICLLIFTGQHRPDGILANLSDEDIALAAQWDGEPQDLITTLIDLRLLDQDGETLTVHDWNTHNPYAAHAPERSERAKKAAAKRWGKEKSRDATSIVKQCGENDLAIQRASSSNAPSPDPFPDPSPDPIPDPKSKDTPPPSAASAPRRGRKKGGYVFGGIPDWINQESWDEYVSMRERIKAPMTDYAKHLTVLELEKLKKDGNDPAAVLNQSSQKSWRGLFAIDKGGIAEKTRSGFRRRRDNGGIMPEPGKYDDTSPLWSSAIKIPLLIAIHRCPIGGNIDGGSTVTPSKAIKIECKVCEGNQHGLCASKHCFLNQAGKSLDRIKAHCQDCAPDHRVEDCTGYLIGTQARMMAAISKRLLTDDGKAQCPLWNYRFGKNVHRKVTVASPKQLASRKLFTERHRAIIEGKILRTKATINENPGVLMAERV